MEDKVHINVTKYQLNPNKILVGYTGLWCNPCKKIKKYIEDSQSRKECPIISEEIITKVSFQENINKYIPFFEITTNDGTLLEKIQTSDSEIFTKFINSDEDF